MTLSKAPDIRLVVLSLDQAFGALRESDDPKSGPFVGVDVDPFVSHALDTLAAHGVPTVLILPKEATEGCIARVQCNVQRVLRQRGSMSATIAACAEAVGCDAKDAIFVAADRVQRGEAADLGLRPAPHALLAAHWVAGQKTPFVRVTGARAELERLEGALPWHLERNPDGRWTMLGTVTPGALASAAVRGVELQRLEADIERGDLLLVRIDAQDRRIEDRLAARTLVNVSKDRALIQLSPSDRVAALDLHGAHGHYLLLTPNPGLMSRAAPARSEYARVAAWANRWPRIEITEALSSKVLELLAEGCAPDPAQFGLDVDRYRGAAPLDGAGPIISRHVDHADNARAVNALLADLRAIGYCPYVHSFAYGGGTRKNVIADLPGKGTLIAKWPFDREHLRQVLVGPELELRRWIDALPRDERTRWLPEPDGPLDRPKLVARLEDLLRFEPWWPWWKTFCLTPAPGLGARLVIVGCHLDSTAASSAPFNPTTDPAPGADDDASGIAAVLAGARYMWKFRGKLPHTVRFCFFNAEEVGLVGSRAYAAKMKSDGAPIDAVICADMVGYNADPAPTFEVHAGYTDPAVRDLSVPIAQKVVDWASATGSLDGQIYQGTVPISGADRMIYDGAINRSDHAAFHEQGYPAVVVSEDFFVNLPGEPAADGNPNYHREADTSVDASYGASIACAIARAARDLASS